MTSSGGSLSSKIKARAQSWEKIWDETSYTQTSRLDIDVSLKDIPMGGLLKEWQAAIIDNMKSSLAASIPEVSNLLDDAMESSVWSWTNGTRDIIDTGQLKNSLQIKMNGFGLIISYSLPYAAIVHYGGITRNGFVYPARPWAQSVLLGEGPVPQADWAAILSKGA